MIRVSGGLGRSQVLLSKTRQTCIYLVKLGGRVAPCPPCACLPAVLTHQKIMRVSVERRIKLLCFGRWLEKRAVKG